MTVKNTCQRIALSFILVALWATSSFAAYTYSRSITIDHTKVPSNQTDFTVLVCANSASPCNTSVAGLNQSGGGAHVTQSDGDDIAFGTNSTCTVLMNWEIEKYTASTGELLAWVKVSGTLSSSSDTVFYICYGDSGVTTFQGGATGAAWDANYLAIYHLGDGTTLSMSDTSGDGNTLTNNNSATAVAAKLDGGVNLDGTNQHLDIASILLPEAFTFSGWVNADTLTPAYSAIFTHQDATPNYYFDLFWRSDGKLAIYAKTDGGGISIDPATTALSTATWYYIAASYDTSNGLDLIFNETNDGHLAGGDPLTDANVNFDIGNDSDTGSRLFDGKVDEVKLSNVKRSADWLKVEYRNQSVPSTFESFGSESGGATTTGAHILVMGQ